MKKFKVFMASVLTYFMAMSILPTTLLQTVANAAENKYSVLVKSDYYLRAEEQYKDSFIVAYGKADDKSKEGEITISLVKGGIETVLKKVNGYYDVQIVEDKSDDSKVLLKTLKDYRGQSEDDNYQEYSFKTNQFSNISKEKWDKNYTNGYEDINAKLTDELARKIINKVNEERNINIDINDKYYTAKEDESFSYKNDTGSLRIRIYPNYANESIIQFGVDNNNYISGDNMYSGLVFNDYIYAAKNDFDYIIDVNNNSNLYIHQYTYDDSWVRSNDSIIKVSNGELISSGKIDFNGEWESYLTDLNNRLYFKNYDGIKQYRLEDNKYIFEENYNTMNNSGVIVKYNEKQIWLLESDNTKVNISKIENNKLDRILDVTAEVNQLVNDNMKYTNTNMKVFNNDNIMLVNGSGFAIIQKSSSGEPSNPVEPSTPEIPTTPENPGNNNEGTKPSEEKVVTEVTKINPNEKNEIPVKTTEGTKNIEVVIKDIEAIKNGNGSLNIATDNGVKINLPLSIIDKSLLEGAKNVTVKLDILENSDITKNVKGVNKVIDFNLIINKEDGTTNVHNFKDGLVEVKINLTDKDFEGLNKDKIVVYYYNDSTKAFEEMETVVNGNEVTFKTPHFSKYVIAEKMDTKNEETPANGGNNGNDNTTENQAETGKGQLPETGARVSSSTILVLAIGILVVGGTMFFRKRKQA